MLKNLVVTQNGRTTIYVPRTSLLYRVRAWVMRYLAL